MKIAVACDHGGYPLKDTILETVRAAGHEPIDLGTYSSASVDYPDFALKLGEEIQEGNADRGVLICGSGVGACIVANKMRGIYASVCHDTYSAHQGVEHDDMNVLCLWARIIGDELAKELVNAFLNANFLGSLPGEGRHARRVNKVRAIERDQQKDI
jgi:ribose 5-phosphate isomerase B